MSCGFCSKCVGSQGRCHLTQPALLWAGSPCAGLLFALRWRGRDRAQGVMRAVPWPPLPQKLAVTWSSPRRPSEGGRGLWAGSQGTTHLLVSRADNACERWARGRGRLFLSHQQGWGP